MELRASLGLLETTREAAHSELHNAQQLGASALFLLSFASRVGSSAPSHLQFDLPFLHRVGQWAKLMDKHGKVLMLEEMVGKVGVEHDRLWQELQVEAKVSEEGWIALVEQELELDAAWAELQGLSSARRKRATFCFPTAFRGPS